MMREQFRREKEHGAGIAIAGHLLGNGLISPGEYREVEAALMKKYNPTVGALTDVPVCRPSADGRCP